MPVPFSWLQASFDCRLCDMSGKHVKRAPTCWSAVVSALAALVAATLATATVVFAAAILRQRSALPQVAPLSLLAESINVLDEHIVNVAPRPLTVEDVEAEALRLAGPNTTRADFHYSFDGVRPRLQQLLATAISPPHTGLGRRIIFEFMSRALAARIQLFRVHAAHKGHIEAQTIAAPTVILGFPRSGTTGFHRLLAQVRGYRPLRCYEARHAAGLPGTSVEAGMFSPVAMAVDPRLDAETRYVASVMQTQHASVTNRRGNARRCFVVLVCWQVYGHA